MKIVNQYQIAKNVLPIHQAVSTSLRIGQGKSTPVLEHFLFGKSIRIPTFLSSNKKPQTTRFVSNLQGGYVDATAVKRTLLQNCL